jgi:uncharacterized phage protein (TIGR02218 family)
MTWLDDERSTELSQPREGLEIRHGNTVHRIATGSRDRVINGNMFFAASVERGELAVTVSGGSADFEITMPTSHAFAQRYFSSPPTDVSLTVYRLQLNSGQVEQYWTGTIIGCTSPRKVVTFRCESRLQIAQRRRLPTVGVSRKCVHVLYGKNCKVARASFRVVATVASYDGKTVTLSTIDGKPDHWGEFGELLHIPSGERMAVVDQVGTLITLQRAIYDLRDTHAVHLFAGCAHVITTCDSKFSNQPNFGGLPELPRGNVLLPDGFGVYQSE